MRRLRVALFPCVYNEVDGVANTMHQFAAFANRHQLPLLNVHGGYGSHRHQDESLLQLEFQRRWPKFRLDARHDFDLNFWRYLREIENAVREFRPDIIHITGPSDVGQIGALIAHRLRIPLVASWHTNVHEYAQQRLMALLPFLPGHMKQSLGKWVRELSFRFTARFYQIARVLFAPNKELIAELKRRTGKPCHLMSRGVDSELFRPEKRNRSDQRCIIGYVGRLTSEKNIRLLVDVESILLSRGCRDFQFVIVGQGTEAPYLRERLRHAQFTGVLYGEALAAAYANFDVFAFPSQTDTFGNVVLEALASGVPAVVTEGGGPKYIVKQGVTGFAAATAEDFAEHVATLICDSAWRRRMSVAARQGALRYSWDAVFEHVYQIYETTLAQPCVAATLIPDWIQA